MIRTAATTRVGFWGAELRVILLIRVALGREGAKTGSRRRQSLAIRTGLAGV
jgi:hypothetical protein